VPIHQPEQDLVPKTLPADPTGRLNYRVGLVGTEVIPDFYWLNASCA
jgi:hypothetical protein